MIYLVFPIRSSAFLSRSRFQEFRSARNRDSTYLTMPTHDSDPLPFIKQKHIQYIKTLDRVLSPGIHSQQKKDELEYWLTEHLRLNGVYWGLTALCLLGQPEVLDRTEMIEYVKTCQTDEGSVVLWV
jgi:prenyltransferase beta subunit